MSGNQRETDIDAAATLLGFRASRANPETLEEAEKEADRHAANRDDSVGAEAAETAPAPPEVIHIRPPGRLPKTAAPPKAKAVETKAIANKFPARLMEMLSDEENTNCISWMPHGRSFLIHDPYKFTDAVLPKYFKGTKFSSFTRKLYRWGFRQISKGPDADTFFHKLFRRDKKTLCDRMTCKEEIRDGCPELHEGINAYSLMRMEQSDMLQEMIRKKQDATKAAEKIAAVDAIQKKVALAEVANAAPSSFAVGTLHTVREQRPGKTCRSKKPTKDVPVRAQASTSSMESGLGLMKRHLAQIKKRRSDLQRQLKAEVHKIDTITESKRRYAQLLTSQERLSPSTNPTGAILQDSQRTSPTLQDIQQMQMQIQQRQQAQMNASRAPAPSAVALTYRNELQNLRRPLPEMPTMIQGGITMPILQGAPRRVSSPPPPAAFPGMTAQFLNQNAGTGTIGADYLSPSRQPVDTITKRYDATKPSSSSQRMDATKHQQINDANHAMASTQALATFTTALQHQFQRSVDQPTNQQNVVAAGVIKRALDNLRSQGLA